MFPTLSEKSLPGPLVRTLPFVPTATRFLASCDTQGSLHADQPIEKLMDNQPNLTTYFQFWNAFQQYRPLHKQAEKVLFCLTPQDCVLSSGPVPQGVRAEQSFHC